MSKTRCHQTVNRAMHSSRSHDAVIRVYDEVGNVMQTHEAQKAISKIDDDYRAKCLDILTCLQQKIF
jgi:hypothetical protein